MTSLGGASSSSWLRRGARAPSMARTVAVWAVLPCFLLPCSAFCSGAMSLPGGKAASVTGLGGRGSLTLRGGGR